jgi:hypothetical protein
MHLVVKHHNGLEFSQQTVSLCITSDGPVWPDWSIFYFSPIRRLFTLGRFWKLTIGPYFWANLFQGKSHVLFWQEKGLATFWALFSKGHLVTLCRPTVKTSPLNTHLEPCLWRSCEGQNTIARKYLLLRVVAALSAFLRGRLRPRISLIRLGSHVRCRVARWCTNIFPYQKFWFGCLHLGRKILVYLCLFETIFSHVLNFWPFGTIFYGHTAYFMVMGIFYVHLVYLCSFGIFFPSFVLLHQEKSGNLVSLTLTLLAGM